MKLVSEFFATARERYHIKQRRESGLPPPWTEDQIFATWRFCNVHREDDKTTRWFRDHVRSKVSGQKAIDATVIFRWFNRIETGEVLADLLLGEWDTEEARRRLDGVKPIVTGAYIIKGMDGYSKLDGVLQCIDVALPMLREMAPYFTSLQSAWTEMKTIPYLGPFMAYEAVSDLRWTDVLAHAPDIDLWANAGPGCTRGLSRVVFGEKGHLHRGSTTDQRQMNSIMLELLDMSRDDRFWPTTWKAWEMREVEHWACEFDKYRRALDGSPLKRRFR